MYVLLLTPKKNPGSLYYVELVFSSIAILQNCVFYFKSVSPLRYMKAINKLSGYLAAVTLICYV